MPVWTIAGESGKAWDGTQQTLEYRAIAGANMTFRSLAVDELTLDIQVEDMMTYTAPELGQIVRLYRNGDLFFTGHVTSNPVSFSQRSQSLKIVVSGPWWWMDRINYTSTQTDGTGATATRMTGVFGTASSGTDLGTAIITAANRMRTLGVPINTIVNVATFFTVPRVTLNQSTCAQVLSELVRLVPDTMVWFDYSAGNPILNVSRRGSATTRTLTVGTSELESIDIQPIYEMKVEQVNLPFVERDRDGKTKFNMQVSGTGTTGRSQIITVSGPELDTFLPNEDFDSVVINVHATLVSYLLNTSEFAPAVKLGLNSSSPLSYVSTTYAGYISPSQTSGFTSYTTRSPSYTDDGGNLITLPSGAWISQDKEADWVTSVIGGQVINTIGTVSSFGLVGLPIPEWAQALGMSAVWYPYWLQTPAWNQYQAYAADYNPKGVYTPTPPHVTGNVVARTNTTITLASGASNIDGFYVGAEIVAQNMPTNPPRIVTAYNGTTKVIEFASVTNAQRPNVGTAYTLKNIRIYKPADYSFIAPPANLAANLLAAQNFVPYEGTITLTQETAGGTRYRGCKVNVSGSLAEHATMGALVAEESLDLATGQTTITLGTPPRLDYRTFVDRIRKTPQDNIVFV